MMNGSFGELENVRFPGNVILLGDLVKQENLGCVWGGTDARREIGRNRDRQI